MPHITIEYTTSLSDVLDAEKLVQTLHDAAIATGVFPVGGIRTFARASVASRVGDGASQNGFVQVNVRIAPGRSLEVRQAVVKALFEAAESGLGSIFEARPFGLQLELSEFDAKVTESRNTMMASNDADRPPATP